jgi:hypothetical protein
MSVCRDSVRGTWWEDSFARDSERHVSKGVEKTEYLIPQGFPDGNLERRAPSPGTPAETYIEVYGKEAFPFI